MDDQVAKDQASHSLEGALAAARQWEAFNGWRSWDMERVHKINQEGNSDFEKALKDLIKLNLKQKTEADRAYSQVNQWLVYSWQKLEPSQYKHFEQVF